MEEKESYQGCCLVNSKFPTHIQGMSLDPFLQVDKSQAFQVSRFDPYSMP